MKWNRKIKAAFNDMVESMTFMPSVIMLFSQVSGLLLRGMTECGSEYLSEKLFKYTPPWSAKLYTYNVQNEFDIKEGCYTFRERAMGSFVVRYQLDDGMVLKKEYPNGTPRKDACGDIKRIAREITLKDKIL